MIVSFGGILQSWFLVFHWMTYGVWQLHLVREELKGKRIINKTSILLRAKKNKGEDKNDSFIFILILCRNLGSWIIS